MSESNQNIKMISAVSDLTITSPPLLGFIENINIKAEVCQEKKRVFLVSSSEPDAWYYWGIKESFADLGIAISIECVLWENRFEISSQPNDIIIVWPDKGVYDEINKDGDITGIWIDE
ncbi:MAG: hypothetical protein HUJ69_09505 [Lachnospiraceae bacterium]|nr:hypothetical protein [Lachnospiraceae bacterium]